MIWNAIKDNFSLKRISLLFYFILFLFYPSLLSKDQTQHNHNSSIKQSFLSRTCCIMIFCGMWLNGRAVLRIIEAKKEASPLNSPKRPKGFFNQPPERAGKLLLKLKPLFTFHFSILTLSNAFLSIINREMKIESCFSQPLRILDI